MPNRRILLAIGAWLVLIVAVAWFFVGRPRGGLSKKQEPLQFLVCPECGYEQRFSKSMLGKVCPKCRDETSKLRGSAKSSRDGGEPTKQSPLAIFMVAGTIFLAGVHLLLIYRSRKSRENIDCDFLKFRCPKCKRKIRYPETHAGNKAFCPTCKEPIVLPGV